MSGKTHGYLMMDRGQFSGDDVVWDDGTPFDSRSAWTWLIQLAAWKDGKYHTKFRYDELKRGEFVASLRFLGERWGWSKNRVSRYLEMLSKAGRIAVQRTGQHGTVYLLVNYDTYQNPKGWGGTATGTLRGTNSGHTRDKVEEGKEEKTTTGYPAEFEMLMSVYPKKPGANKREAFRVYNLRLKDGCSFDSMFEGAKSYNAYCVSQGTVGTKYVKGPEVFFGPDRHFASDWSVSAPIPEPKGDDRATRIWAGMKRTKVLFSVNAEQWQERMADMVEHGEAESADSLIKLIKTVNRTQLQEAKNDHFAIQHIADALPAQLKIA